jgi:hypothetical protein
MAWGPLGAGFSCVRHFGQRPRAAHTGMSSPRTAAASGCLDPNRVACLLNPLGEPDIRSPAERNSAVANVTREPRLAPRRGEAGCACAPVRPPRLIEARYSSRRDLAGCVGCLRANSRFHGGRGRVWPSVGCRRGSCVCAARARRATTLRRSIVAEAAVVRCSARCCRGRFRMDW